MNFSQEPQMGRQLVSVAAAFVTGSFLIPSPAAGQDAATILSTVEQMQAERYASVDHYWVSKAIEAAGGMRAPLYFEKFQAADGGQYFRFVPPGEYNEKVMTDAGFPPMTPEDLDAMAGGYDMVGGALSSGGDDMPPMPGMGAIMGSGAMFLRAAADAKRNENDGRADAEAAADQMDEFARRARLEGRVSLDLKDVARGLESEANGADSWVPDEALRTRDAFLLVVDDMSGIDLEQPEEGGEFALSRASLWIDAEHYVPLRLLMEGEIENDGETTPFNIEKLNLDFRQIGPLYEPFLEVFRMSGIMSGLSEKDKKEMEKARKDLAAAKKQMEAMPASQRAMVEKMMRGQLEKAERMLAGDAIVTSIRTVALAVNEGPPTPYGSGTLSVGSASFPGALTVAYDKPEGGTLEVAAQNGSDRSSLVLKSDAPFPGEGGSMTISGANGWAIYGGMENVALTEGTGSISITERSETRIAGSFSASLTGTGPGDEPVTLNASGTFDTGAPAGLDKAPRGSLFPGSITEMGPPDGSPAAGP
ncbi:MAG: hypothetical protein ACR2GQ_09205 [Gemmatimonadota bacterium]